MDSMQPAISTDLFMETIRRSADSMDREELLMVVHHLSHAYSVQRAAAIWAVNQAAENLRYGCTAGNCPSKQHPTST